jgi:hypothetical protein
MEGSQVATLPTLRFRLPGQWFQIPLQSREGARSAVERLVRQQVGPADDRAGLRRELTARFFAALEGALDGNGQSMQVAITIVPEVPISANFTVFLPQVTLTPAVGTSPAVVMDLLRRGLDDATDLSSEVRFDTAESAVLRLHRRQAVKVDDETDDLPALAVDYWVTVPGHKRVVLVSFATVYAELEDVMLTFFDSIMRATYWEDRANI